MAATTQYLRNTQTGGGTGGAVYDLSTTQGSAATLSASVSSNTFAEVLRFQITLGADLPATDIPFSISINAIAANSEVRWRIQELNGSNTVIASSSFATAVTTTGTKTGTISFSNSWATNDRLAISVEYRRTSGSGSRALTIDINSASSYVQPDLIPQAQALTQASRFDNSQTFYGPTVTKGAVTLTPALFTNTQTFHAPFLTKELLTEEQDFGLVTATPDVYFALGLVTESSDYTNDFGDLDTGAATQNLTAALFTNTNTFYGPTVTATYALTATRYDNEQTFYGPTVTTAYALTAARYDNEQTFYAPTATANYPLVAARYDNEQTFYAPSVTTNNALTAVRFDNTNVFYDATVTSSYALTADRFDNTNTFYDPAVTYTYALTAARFDNENIFYEPAVAASYALTPDLFTNTNTFYAAVVVQEGGEQYLVPDLFTNTNVFYEAEITQSAAPQFIEPLRFDNTNVFYLHKIEGGQVDVVEGGGKGSSGRSRRVYLERNNQVYVFADEAQAEAWAKQEVKPKKARKKAAPLESKPLDKIDLGAVKTLAERYGKQTEFDSLIAVNRYADLVQRYQLLLSMDMKARLAEAEDEDEIAILLMAA